MCAPVSAEAINDCLICVMSRTDQERIIVNKPQVALRLLELMGERLSAAEERLEYMAFKGIPARLATLLLHLMAERGSCEIVGISHQDMAERVGTYRETATQVLNTLKSQGVVELGRMRIVILDTGKLSEIAANQ